MPLHQTGRAPTGGHGVGESARSLEGGGQRRCGAHCDHPQVRALRRRPLIEIGGVAEMEAVEEVAEVERQRVGPSLFRGRPPKFDEVGRRT